MITEMRVEKARVESKNFTVLTFLKIILKRHEDERSI